MNVLACIVLVTAVLSSVVLDSVTTKDERPFMYFPAECCVILSGTSVTTKDERPCMHCPGECCIILSGTSVTTEVERPCMLFPGECFIVIAFGINNVWARLVNSKAHALTLNGKYNERQK